MFTIWQYICIHKYILMNFFFNIYHPFEGLFNSASRYSNKNSLWRGIVDESALSKHWVGVLEPNCSCVNRSSAKWEPTPNGELMFTWLLWLFFNYIINPIQEIFVPRNLLGPLFLADFCSTRTPQYVWGGAVVNKIK